MVRQHDPGDTPQVRPPALAHSAPSPRPGDCVGQPAGVSATLGGEGYLEFGDKWCQLFQPHRPPWGCAHGVVANAPPRQRFSSCSHIGLCVHLALLFC